MKRVGHLFDQIPDRDNLRLAFHKALRGKRSRGDAREFARNLDGNLDDLAAGLRAGTVPGGRFQQFVIHDPKERIITAPCFAERVLHHAIMNVCEPHLERWLIPDTYACRRGKGRVAALQRARHFAGRFARFLQLDVRHYFDSVPHDRLLERLARRFKDRRLLALLERIVRGFRGALGRGLPIGSLTSQHLANFYLGWLDRFVKERLGVRGYVRYMDDMALWAHDPGELKAALAACREFLDRELGLELKAAPPGNRTEHGMDFLGCRVFRQHLTLNRRSRVRFARRLRRLEEQYQRGALDAVQLQRRATALVAFARSAGVSTWRFRSAVVQRLPVSGRTARTG